MDKFEKHIRDNSSLFDEHKADADKMWAHIKKALDEPTINEKRKSLWQHNFLRVAASIVIIFGLFTINNVLNNRIENNNIAN